MDFLSYKYIVDWGYTENGVAKTHGYFQKWIDQNLDFPLKYLLGEKAQKRKSITEYYPQFKSSLVFLFSYAETKKNLIALDPEFKIAGYALGFNGIDYHHELKKILEHIFMDLKKTNPKLECKIALDTQPVLDRDLAYRAGLGWFGKNSMLISRHEGSYFIIGSLLLSEKLNFIQKELEADHCGSCTKCIDACPTKAIDSLTRTIVTKKCISYFTIEEFKDVTPSFNFSNTSPEIFGCDICQDVCPWNEKKLSTFKNAKPVAANVITEFFYRSKEVVLKNLQELSNNQYKKLFKNTALERTGRIGILKNLRRFFNE